MAEDIVRPTCRCHGEPMVRNGIYRPTGREKWQCSVKNRDRAEEWYWHGASNQQIRAKLFRGRRTQALQRMAAREVQRGSL